MSFLTLGREPSETVALLMAEAITASYSAYWPAEAKAAITPEVLLRSLAPEAHGGLTSRRPALLTYALGRMGDGQRGNPDEVMNDAMGAVMGSVRESARHTPAALWALSRAERSALRAVAAGGYTCAELEAIRMRRGQFKEGSVGMQSAQLASLISCLQEAGEGDDVARLQPPYSTQVQKWVRPDGELAVRLGEDGKPDVYSALGLLRSA